MYLSVLYQKLKFSTLYFYASLFSCKRQIPDIEKIIICNNEQVKFYADTPNTIIYFNTGSCEGFFRECRQHLQKKQFIESLIKDYCTYIVDKAISTELYKEIMSYLSKSENCNRFFQMGDGTNPYAPINKFRKTSNPNLIGFDNAISQLLRSHLIDIVQFSWGPISEYKYCRMLKNTEYHLYNSSRSLATKIMTDLLGCNHIVPNTYYAKLILDGTERYGIVVERADGIAPVQGAGYEVSGTLQQDINNLNIIDALLYQKDHRPGNYYISVENNKMVAISAFDNDCPSTLLPSMSVNMVSYLGSSPIVKKRLFNRLFLSSGLYSKLKSLTWKDIDCRFHNCTSVIERFALFVRVEQLKLAIDKSVKIGATKILEDGDWGKYTVAEEMGSTKNGQTYLRILLEHYN